MMLHVDSNVLGSTFQRILRSGHDSEIQKDAGLVHLPTPVGTHLTGDPVRPRQTEHDRCLWLEGPQRDREHIPVRGSHGHPGQPRSCCRALCGWRTRERSGGGSIHRRHGRVHRGVQGPIPDTERNDRNEHKPEPADLRQRSTVLGVLLRRLPGPLSPRQGPSNPASVRARISRLAVRSAPTSPAPTHMSARSRERCSDSRRSALRLKRPSLGASGSASASGDSRRSSRATWTWTPAIREAAQREGRRPGTTHGP